MKTLELNKAYQLKNGCYFIADQDKCLSPTYVFGGIIFNADGTKNRIAYYTATGMYKAFDPSGFDIIN